MEIETLLIGGKTPSEWLVNETRLSDEAAEQISDYFRGHLSVARGNSFAANVGDGTLFR
jgi:hypothetical protein